jgi:transcription initiation factor IIF auxiliary subunit
MTSPFELREKGWGEFELAISLQFADSSLPDVRFQHILKLYPEEGESGLDMKKPVQAEIYDEIVFSSPVAAVRSRIRDMAPQTSNSTLLQYCMCRSFPFCCSCEV